MARGCHKQLGEATSLEELGLHFGGLFYEAEARYLIEKSGRNRRMIFFGDGPSMVFTLATMSNGPLADGLPPPAIRHYRLKPAKERIMALSLSLNTNPLVNRIATPEDLLNTIARQIRIRDIQLTHEFINPAGLRRPSPRCCGE